MHTISPFLWFNNNAEEAVNFYTSTFKDSKITATTRYGSGGPGPAGSVMTMSFELNGQHFTALNGGPHYQFTPAISFVIMCSDQEEVDHYWNNFLDGGKAMQCGWITDKFGLTWQVIPSAMITMMTDKDPKKAQKVAQTMMQMVKLDIAALQKAYDEA